MTNRAVDVYDMIAEVMVAKGESWRNRAACRGSNAHGESVVFFPTRTTDGQQAKEICAACPVRVECYHDWTKMPPAMQKHGIWAGKTVKDRSRDKAKHRKRIK